MNNVWYAIPSCRERNAATACLDRWRAMGYRIALLRQGDVVSGDIVISTDRYLGWAQSVNILAARILQEDPDAAFVVSGGDDYYPDPAHWPEQIAWECKEHFGGTFGVMQPTGHRWGDSPMTRAQFGEHRGALIDRIAGSPWLGREWCQRAFGGRGPMPGEFFHMYGDEALQEVAQKFGRFWQRRDLCQFHDHWGLDGDDSKMPDYIKPVNDPMAWRDAQQLFNSMKAKQWAGCEPLPRSAA